MEGPNRGDRLARRAGPYPARLFPRTSRVCLCAGRMLASVRFAHLLAFGPSMYDFFSTTRVPRQPLVPAVLPQASPQVAREVQPVEQPLDRVPAREAGLRTEHGRRQRPGRARKERRIVQ